MIDALENDAGIPAADLKKTKRQKGGSFSTAQLASRLDRLPPHSVEAEQGVLGCLMLSPSDNIGTCIEKFKGGGEVFYDLRHRSLYELLVEMYDAKDAIDLITVPQRLKDKNQLEGVGGVAYITSLLDAVPSAVHLPYYVDIVREKFVLRKMIRTCTDVVGRVYDHEGEVDDHV